MESRKAKTITATMVVVCACGLLAYTLIATGGSLEPSAPPGPTMKTLDEIYNKPVWRILNKQFVDWPANPRFAVCDNGTPANSLDDMVLDKETGLVWERAPEQQSRQWDAAMMMSYSKILGGRMGWRLPTIEELTSLIDPTESDPALPNGHPFINVQSTRPYHTVNTYVTDAKWGVLFFDGSVGYIGKDLNYYMWCVRGGYGHDGCN